MDGRFALRVILAIGLSLVSPPAARAQDSCADLAVQLSQQDQALDAARAEAVPWLQMAGQSAPAVVGELTSAAAAGDVPILTPDLAATDAAVAAQAGAEMAQLATDAGAEDAASFASDLSQRMLDWQTRLAPLQHVAIYSASLSALFEDIQSLLQVASQAQAALALRNNFRQSLADCLAHNPQTPAFGCGLTYLGLDRSSAPGVLKPAVPGLTAGATPGTQWESPTSYTTDDGSTIDAVDTYTCTSDGATKLARTAVQTFPDGSTAEWGERDYVGTLWPKTIVPGASWQWQAVQHFGAPDDVGDEESWNVTVHDVARESLQLPQGKFVAIQLHMDEDIVQANGDTQHVSWDEWYAQPQP